MLAQWEKKKGIEQKPCCGSREVSARLFLSVTGQVGKKVKIIIKKKHNPESEKCLPERDRYALENRSNLFHVR